MKFETKSLCAATALITLALASGCAGNQPAPAKILAHSAPFMYLQDEDIARNKGNIEGLFNTWIKPRLGSYGTIELSSAKIKTSALAGIQDGMTRFCKESHGTLQRSPLSGQFSGTDYVCKDSNGAPIGQLSVIETSSWLQLETNSNIKRAKELKLYQERLQSNGPSGQIVTTEGTYTFLRIGNLDQRALFNVAVFGLGEKSVEIEDIRRIEFDEKCCEFKVSLPDGRTGIMAGHISRQTAIDESTSSRISTFVVRDPDSGQPYARWFPLEQIKVIYFDEKRVWAQKPYTAMPTSFNPTSPDRMLRYKAKLRKDASVLVKQATAQGWWQLVFPGGKLAHGYKEDIDFYLARSGNRFIESKRNDPDCMGNARTGLKGKGEDVQRCQVASHEYTLVAEDGIALSVDSTPLALIHILSRAKERLGK